MNYIKSPVKSERGDQQEQSWNKQNADVLMEKIDNLRAQIDEVNFDLNRGYQKLETALETDNETALHEAASRLSDNLDTLRDMSLNEDSPALLARMSRITLMRTEWALDDELYVDLLPPKTREWLQSDLESWAGEGNYPEDKTDSDDFTGHKWSGDLHGVIKRLGLRGYLKEKLGTDVLALSDSAQQQMVEYLATAKQKEFAHISDVSLGIPDEQQRIVFMEAFLATEFGEDYGDAILDIEENTTSEQSNHIFETMNNLRKRTREYADLFGGIDPKLAEATKKALDERIADTFVALREVAVNGSLHEDVAPHINNPDYVRDGRFDIDVKSINEAIEIINSLDKTFELMHDIFQAKDLRINKVNENTAQFVMYRFVSEKEGNMTLYVRPEGAYGYDRRVEYGNRKGVEASISFVVNPADPHKFLEPKDGDAVSTRSDREGRLVGENPSSDRRDPTRPDGLISIDVSSSLGEKSSLPVRIGRFIAAGNRIRSRRQGSGDSLHHNTNYLNQDKYGSSVGFASLARDVIRMAEALRRTTNSRRLGGKIYRLTRNQNVTKHDIAA